MSEKKEYIEKKEALDSICCRCREKIFCRGLCLLCTDYRRISELSPADVHPVVRGEWIARHYVADNLDVTVCSECGNEYSFDAETGESAEDYFNFCPSCGAAMTDEAVRILAERNKWGDTEDEE